MKFRFLYLVIFLTLSVNVNKLLGQNQDRIISYSEYLKAPTDIHILSEDTLLVYDPANSDYHVYILDLKNESIVSKIRTGRGPGELLGKMYKTIMHAPGNKISIYDRGLMRTNIYDQDLDFIKTLKFGISAKRFMHTGFINDSTFFGVHPNDEFITAYNLTQIIESVDSSPQWTIRNDENKYTAPLSNFLLKQDLVFEQGENSLYIAFKYSSLLMKINEKGVAYYTNGPDAHPLPDEQPEDGGVYSLPDIGKYPICTLDVDVQGDHVYVLYSGKKISDKNLFSRMFNRYEAVESIKHSDQLLKYDKTSGRYIESIQLPHEVKRVEIIDNFIYLMGYVSEDTPTIYKYPISILE